MLDRPTTRRRLAGPRPARCASRAAPSSTAPMSPRPPAGPSPASRRSTAASWPRWPSAKRPTSTGPWRRPDAPSRPGVWRDTAPAQKKQVLLRFAELIRADLDELALLETLDTGRVIGNALAVDVPFCADAIQYYAELADKLIDEIAPVGPKDVALMRREPLGVVAAIVPWNYPLIISAWKLGPALVAGNSVVLKPAEQSPPQRDPPRRAGQGGGPARRRAERRAGLRRGRRRAARPARRRRHGHLHRLDRGRQADAALCRREQHEAGQPRMRRQEPACRAAPTPTSTPPPPASPGASSTTRARPATRARACIVHRSVQKALVEKIAAVAAQPDPARPPASIPPPRWAR